MFKLRKVPNSGDGKARMTGPLDASPQPDVKGKGKQSKVVPFYYGGFPPGAQPPAAPPDIPMAQKGEPSGESPDVGATAGLNALAPHQSPKFMNDPNQVKTKVLPGSPSQGTGAAQGLAYSGNTAGQTYSESSPGTPFGLVPSGQKETKFEGVFKAHDLRHPTGQFKPNAHRNPQIMRPDATDANPDPDKDGDDDRTPEGDTDHDYWTREGKPIAKAISNAFGFQAADAGKPAGTGSPEQSAAEQMVRVAAKRKVKETKMEFMKIMKASPDQARDDNGRWTSGGAGGASGEKIHAGVEVKGLKNGERDVLHNGAKIGNIVKGTAGYHGFHQDVKSSGEAAHKTVEAAAKHISQAHSDMVNSRAEMAGHDANYSGRGNWSKEDYEKAHDAAYAKHDADFRGEGAKAHFKPEYKEAVGDKGKDNVTLKPHDQNPGDMFSLHNTNRGGAYYHADQAYHVADAVQRAVNAYHMDKSNFEDKKSASWRQMADLHREGSHRYPDIEPKVKKADSNQPVKFAPIFGFQANPWDTDDMHKSASYAPGTDDKQAPAHNGDLGAMTEAQQFKSTATIEEITHKAAKLVVKTQMNNTDPGTNNVQSGRQEISPTNLAFAGGFGPVDQGQTKGRKVANPNDLDHQPMTYSTKAFKLSVPGRKAEIGMADLDTAGKLNPQQCEAPAKKKKPAGMAFGH